MTAGLRATRGRDGATAALVHRFATLGVAVIEHAFKPCDLTTMTAHFPALGARTAGARQAGFSPDAQAWLAGHDVLAALAMRLGGSPMRMARALAFDKSEPSNWFVPWHQDRAADGRERETVELERIVTLRVHLDGCLEDDGPLEVIAGSHAAGRLDAVAIARLVAERPALVCLADRGDIVAMRPLLVHRSQRARKPSSRRVLHLEYVPVTSSFN